MLNIIRDSSETNFWGGTLQMENLIVYQSIREHILQKETEVTNELTYMYVTYFGLLVSGAIWSSWLSLVSFIDLIVFQAMINRSQLSITKATMYIQIFFEEKRGDIHWESLHQDSKFLSAYNKVNGNIGWRLCTYGATILAIVSFLYVLIPVLNIYRMNFNLVEPQDIIQVLIAAVLMILTAYVNYLHAATLSCEKSEDLRIVMRGFYSSKYNGLLTK